MASSAANKFVSHVNTSHQNAISTPRVTIASTTMQWSCRTCTLTNSADNLQCELCKTRRHAIPEVEAVRVVEHKKVIAQVPAPVSNKLPVTTKNAAPKNTSANDSFLKRKVLQGLDNISGTSTQKLTKNQEHQIIGGIQKMTLTARSETGASGSKNVSGTKDKARSESFWNCEACTLLNPLVIKNCSVCGTPQSQPVQNAGSPSPTKHVEKFVASRRKSNDPRGPVKPGVKETYDNILSTCEELAEEFVDDSFRPGPSALFIDGQGPGFKKFQVPHVWLRPSEISWYDASRNAKSSWSIMTCPTPSDIYQGALGDCWLMGSLAMITERKELLDNIIRTKQVNPAGAYIIRLNHFGKWKDVIVDDLLPCDKYKRLIYAKGKRKQLWVPLIEKAMAKLHGSYEALIGGSNSESLTTLTGFPCSSINLNNSELDKDLTWATLVSSVSAGFLIGTGTHGRDLQKMEENERMGLKAKHAYSILEVNDQFGVKLIKLRNPWGRESWSGGWCSSSSLWRPEMKKALLGGSTDKGTFWMCFEDFVRHFEVLDICRIRQNWEYNSFQGIFVPYADRVSHPCYSIEVERPTDLDVTLFQSTWSRHRKRSDSTDIIPDVALALLKSTGESAKEWQMVTFTERVKDRDVNLNCMVDPGVYKLIPVSFGHWTTSSSDDNSESFPEFEISIHSSRSITCTRVQPPGFLLADLIIKIGLQCCSILTNGNPNTVFYHNQSAQTFGKGSLYIAENRHKDKWIIVEVDLRSSENVIGTRPLKTIDCIPPNSRQIVNLLTLNNHQLSYNFKFSLLTYTLSSHERAPNLRKFGYNGTHFPELTPTNEGLHTPRPI